MEVSVVIPNFNGIAFLDSVLGSLEGQTIKNFEAVLLLQPIIPGSTLLNFRRILDFVVQ